MAERKYKKIHLTLADEHLKICDSLRRKMGNNRSAFIRFLLVMAKDKKIENLPTEESIKELIVELRKLGNDLNQIARGFNTSQSLDYIETKKVLVSLRKKLEDSL